MLRQASALHAAGDLPAAEALYVRILAQHPDEPNALNLLGTLKRQQGLFSNAVPLVRRALALRPGAPVFQASLGALLAETGALEEAVVLLRQATAQRPEDALSLRNLGQALCGLGQARAALSPLRRAVKLRPDAAAQLALAHACREAGARPEARAAAEAAARDPDFAEQAGFLLAALGAAATPDRAPAAYVRDLFDQYAPRFEADLTGKLGYRTPEALAGLLRETGIAEDRSLDVLDLGCGTGLSGRALAPFARRLEGLDLSPRMLEAARAAGGYDALHEADLLDFLPAHPARFDLVAAADVLNYLGALDGALAAMVRALRPGGIAAFSLELGEAAPFALGEGLRYRHAPAAIAGLCAAAGLAPLAERRTVLREERGAPVEGLLLLLRR
nr:methyltransferase domain-containing protein [Pseudoroseomonas deserti]